ncbi:DUF5615 family PIN-like protein [Paractinoplanes maris]|uniref:DUF5615 family PIN-like protein n=1 Tax=Paractinoplanes maris TaxID=1734446 RepID=UPI002020692D|nr:DUF5615 family PIN-like protein [Actinoplanes maris]
MRILLDEDVPRPSVDLLRHVLHGHDVDHVHLIKWAGKKDLVLYQDAKRAGYDVVVTNDAAQMSDPDECREVKRAGMHRVSYKQRHPGLRGLAVAVASLVAAMPDVVAVLADAEGQRLVAIIGIDLTHKRFSVVDPRHDPPTYWPR